MRAKVIAVAAVAAFLGALWVGPASAQYVGGRPPGVGQPGDQDGLVGQRPPPDVRLRRAPLSPVNVLITGAQFAPPKVRVVRVLRVGGADVRQAGGIAFTGADIAQLLLIGGALVVAGTVLTRGARRRPTASDVALR